MENASKALIIAGAILLAILIISLGIGIVRIAQGATEGISLDPQKVQAYNSTFLTYEGTQSGTSVRALCDEIRNHNNVNTDDTSRQIGIIYGSTGTAKTEATIDTEITYDIATAVRKEIKAGKTYEVEFTTAKSGMIISATIKDKE